MLVIAVMLTLSFLRQPEANVRTLDSRPQSGKSTNAGTSVARESGIQKVTESSDSQIRDPEKIAVARENILEEIQDAAVSYDAAELPKIEPYLLHPDQEIRHAAMNGMITLGDAAASPLLRKAAGLAPTPQEAVALVEAADYVELPPGKLRRRTK